MATLIKQDQFNQNYSDNLCTRYGAFMILDTWALRSGTGTAVIEPFANSFKGRNSLKIRNTSTTLPITVWSGNTDDVIQLQSGRHWLQVSVFSPIANDGETITGRLIVYDALTDILTFEFSLDEHGKWITFAQAFTLAGATDLSITYEVDSIGSTFDVHFDGIMISRNDRNNVLPSLYTKPETTPVIPYIEGVYAITSESVNGVGTKILYLEGDAVLDFPSISGSGHEDLTITVTGAAVGDPVSLGSPTPPDDSIYTAFVSATNIVTVRLLHSGGGSVNPESATFKVKVFK
jgi:hypothetical protein